MRRLRERCDAGCGAADVSGKHYPGEQLPRWALDAHWRTDGEPFWRDSSLLASEDDTDDATAADAQRFCCSAGRASAGRSLADHPAYEDIYYYLCATSIACQ